MKEVYDAEETNDTRNNRHKTNGHSINEIIEYYERSPECPMHVNVAHMIAVCANKQLCILLNY